MIPQPEEFLLRLADTNLVAAQRLGEVIGHAPEIEQDISLTNIGLDYLERARTLYQYLAAHHADNRTEDSYAFKRTPADFRNLCLAELPNTDFAHLILRQFLLDAWHLELLARLSTSTHTLLCEHAPSWLDQSRYHHRYTLGWVRRLADGTVESRRRMQAALHEIWPFTREALEYDAVEQEAERFGIGSTLGLGEAWLEDASRELTNTGLDLPEPDGSAHKPPVGKQGHHTGFLDELLGELQFMQRQYPDLDW